MNEKKLAAAVRGLNATEAKVLDCVPLQDAWSPSQIHQELYRQGKSVAFDVVAACLHALSEYGLIKFKARKYTRVDYERVKPKPTPYPDEFPDPVIPAPVIPVPVAKADVIPAKPVTPVTPKKTMTLNKTTTAATVASPSAAPIDLLGKLAEMAAGLRKRSDELSAQADELDALAMTLAEQEQVREQDLAKARQLRELLKSF